jgi:hypothetical protein
MFEIIFASTMKHHIWTTVVFLDNSRLEHRQSAIRANNAGCKIVRRDIVTVAFGPLFLTSDFLGEQQLLFHCFPLLPLTSRPNYTPAAENQKIRSILGFTQWGREH